MPATFDLLPLRFRFIASRPMHFPVGASTNLLRGALGQGLMRIAPEAYARWFAPESSSGPSGLRAAPRPFVFRASHLDGLSLAAGSQFQFGVNLFETREEAVDLFSNALEDRFGPASIEGREPLRLPLEPPPGPIQRVRIRFLTPTELKGGESQPEFGFLFARIRDRTSTLRALYGAGPLEIDFKAMGDRAAQIRLTKCELQHVDAERVSRGTGQRHSLGGFVGSAEYEGDLAEFLPYLEIARWTGVGRQTVWGKGEIGWEAY